MAPRPPLQFDTDDRLETIWKVLQKGLLVLLSLMVVAGLLGLLGRGPLSHAVTPLPAIQGAVRYDHLARNTTSGQSSVEWKSRPAAAQTEISLDRGLPDAVQVTATTPTASAYRITPDGAAWSFAAPPQGAGQIMVNRVTFHIGTSKVGLTRGRLRLLGQDAVLKSFVFP